MNSIYEWSIAGPSKDPYIPNTMKGDRATYMRYCYPVYARLGLLEWQDVFKHLEERQ